MNPTSFPLETDATEVDVVLPVGTHVLTLVVRDDAGTESQPDTVVITVEEIPVPTIITLTPDHIVKGVTVDAVVHGQHLDEVIGLDVYRDTQIDDRITVTRRQGGTDTQLPLTIAVMENAVTGPRTLTLATPGGTAMVEFRVLPLAGVRIRAVTPTSSPVGREHPIAVRIDGDNLDGATAMGFLHRGQRDDFIDSRVRATGIDYVDGDVSISVNAPFGRRGLWLDTPAGEADSPPDVRFTVGPDVQQYSAMALTLLTAVIYLTLDFADTLFILNGLAYLVVLAALYLPLSAVTMSSRRQIRWLLILYAVVNIVVWLFAGDRTPPLYLTKAAEIGLVLLLLVQSRRA